MTNELTPEERAELDKLPRERIPVGLEARVVDAMRERGFLAKRRRTIEVTGGRAAGVLAASVALMIGAYSIGLHRGGGDEALAPSATTQPDDRGRVGTPVEPRESKGMGADEVSEAEPPAVADADESRVQESKAQRSDAPPARPVPPARSDEATADQVGRVETREAEGLARSDREIAPTPLQEKSAPQTVLTEPASRALAPRVDSDRAKRPLTFLLNGLPVVVEAPDSVRVVQNDGGGVLIIYTSDGVIRIRQADDD